LSIGAPSPTFDWSIVPGGSAPEHGRRVLAGRYELGSTLGSGGQGSVYRARDLLTGEELAVKMLPVLSTAARHRVNLEITALRWLRMPGVVQLQDDGVVDDMIFLVMDVVEGRPFPVGPLSWSELRPYALAILETLQAVHAAGVVHRDIKPSNMLIDGHGRPVLIDFGLARGTAITRTKARRRSGTMQYSSPEQLAGEACGPASDLYSLAVVLYESLCGYLPHGHDWREIVQRRSSGELPAVPMGAPMEVTSVLMQMLALDPNDRPGSAAEVLEAWGGVGADAQVERMCRNLPERSTRQELRALFSGPDLFLHLREDGAEVLYARTDGWRSQVIRELGRWIRLGRARYKAGRISIDRVAIDRLSEPELAMLLPGEAIAGVQARAEELAELGQHAQAIGCLATGVSVARRFCRTEDYRELLELWVQSAVKLQSKTGLNRVLAELGRARAHGLDCRELTGLVRGFWLARNGEYDRAVLALPAALESESLEVLRSTALVVAAKHRGLAEHGAELERLRSWCTTPQRQAHWDGWEGLRRYQAGDYNKAVELHLKAMQGRAGVPGQLTCLLNAGAAALETDQLDVARDMADEALRLANEVRDSNAAAAAFRIARAAAYRQGATLLPMPEALAAAEHLGPWRTLTIAVTEAAIAWRAGARDVALDLALRGRSAAQAASFGDVVDLCQALAQVVGHPRFPSWHREYRVPSIGFQVLGLRALSGETRLPLMEPPSTSTPDRRGEVLSVAEVLSALQSVTS
jgi:hypothetical protein